MAGGRPPIVTAACCDQAEVGQAEEEDVEQYVGLTCRWSRPRSASDAAGIILHRVAKWSTLKAWGSRLAKRIGAKKATVAVARKLAGIRHRMWKDGSEFRWSAQDAKAA